MMKEKLEMLSTIRKRRKRLTEEEQDEVHNHTLQPLHPGDEAGSNAETTDGPAKRSKKTERSSGEFCFLGSPKLIKFGENVSFGFNNALFSDCIIKITLQEEEARMIEHCVYVSKLFIHQHSPMLFARGKRVKEGGEENINIGCEISLTLISEVQFEQFMDILRMIYNLKPNLETNDQKYQTLLLAENFQFFRMERVLADELCGRIESIESGCWLLEVMELNPPQLAGIYQQLLQAAESILEKVFSQNFEKMMFTEEFLNLPYVGLRSLLKNRNLLISSENTLFYALILWYQNDRNNRLNGIKTLLEFVKFQSLSDPFLLSVVLQSDQYVPELSQVIQMKRLEAMTIKLNTQYQTGRLLPPEITSINPTIHLAMTFVFSNMSTFTVNQGRLSSPYYRNGFIFQFFIEAVLKSSQREPPKTLKNHYSNYHLKGGLRCETLSSKFYLPVEFSMFILSATEPRTFGPFRAIFESSKSAFGCILNKANENLSQIVTDNCPIIKKNALVIQIQMKF